MPGAHVRDVDTAAFQQDVVDRSREVPVLVDFWADWCGPCRILGPTLEAAVAARDGAVELAKVDVDSNQGLAQQFGVQGIPAVKAFRDGEVVAEFVGAINAAQVDAFLDELLTDDAAVEDTDDADHDDPGAATDDALPFEELVALSDHAEANQDDGTAVLPYGEALARSGFHQEAIEVLLHVLGLGPEHRDAARDALVELLNSLSNDDPMVLDARRRLATALF